VGGGARIGDAGRPKGNAKCKADLEAGILPHWSPPAATMSLGGKRTEESTHEKGRGSQQRVGRGPQGIGSVPISTGKTGLGVGVKKNITLEDRVSKKTSAGQPVDVHLKIDNAGKGKPDKTRKNRVQVSKISSHLSTNTGGEVPKDEKKGESDGEKLLHQRDAQNTRGG